MQTLDAYVDMDYSLVYFHHGLTSKNKPPLRWLWEVYKALDRRYKKNLKSLYLVHPTNFIRVVWNFFKPIIRYVRQSDPIHLRRLVLKGLGLI
jgi:Rho GTPase-activating protein 1